MCAIAGPDEDTQVESCGMWARRMWEMWAKTRPDVIRFPNDLLISYYKSLNWFTLSVSESSLIVT